MLSARGKQRKGATARDRRCTCSGSSIRHARRSKCRRKRRNPSEAGSTRTPAGPTYSTPTRTRKTTCQSVIIMILTCAVIVEVTRAHESSLSAGALGSSVRFALESESLRLCACQRRRHHMTEPTHSAGIIVLSRRCSCVTHLCRPSREIRNGRGGRAKLSQDTSTSGGGTLRPSNRQSTIRKRKRCSIGLLPFFCLSRPQRESGVEQQPWNSLVQGRGAARDRSTGVVVPPGRRSEHRH